MTLRAALPESERRLEAVTLVRAGEILGCDPATVRALLRCGALEGHRVGKTDKPGGVRVELQSVLDYKARHAIGGEASAPAPRRREATAGHREAMAALRAMGMRL